jgi:hypothetical protein
MTSNGHAGEPDDEVMRRAMEIHRRLMREQGLDFFNDRESRLTVPRHPAARDEAPKQSREG